MLFSSIERTINARTSNDCCGFHDDRHVRRDRLQRSPVIGKLLRRKPCRLSGDRRFRHVLDHRGGGCKQVVCKLSLILNPGTDIDQPVGDGSQPLKAVSSRGREKMSENGRQWT
jgi:hypothetical protein